MSHKSSDPIERASRIAPIVTPEQQTAIHASPRESVIQVEMETGAMPVAQSNAQKFMELMNKHLKATLDDDIGMMLLRNKVGLKDLTLKQLDRMLPIQIRFSDGTIEYDYKGKRNYVQLSFLIISALGATMKVGAYGTSEDAEKAMGKMYECVFEAAGMKSQWAEARDKIIAKGYATSTVETFDGHLNRLLAPALASLFTSESFAQKGFSSAIGVLPLNQDTGKPFPRPYRSVLKLGALEVSVIRLDDETGDRHASTIRIAPHTMADAGVGRFVVMSELEYNKHQELVALIKEAVSKT